VSPRFLTHIEIEPLNSVVSDWKLPPYEMKSGLYFCAFCAENANRYDLPLPSSEIRVWQSRRYAVR